MRVLWAVEQGLQFGSRRMAASLGVTWPQRLVIRIAGQYPGISAGELAKILHVHPSTLTPILARLEGRDIIECRIPAHDKRRVQLYLSRKGKRLNKARAGTVEAVVGRALLSVTPAEVIAVQRVLGTIAARLKAAWTLPT
jgi:DNA-binding MarR family transcriptional regulator